MHLLGGEPALVARQRRQQRLGDVVGRLELVGDVVALLGHPDEQLAYRLEGVQSAGTADPVVAGRMVVEHYRHFAFTGRSASQPGP